MRWVNQYIKEGNVNKHYRKPIRICQIFIRQELVNKHNNILYAVPYQHNSIENYFSMLKSRLQKLDGLTYNELKKNIKKVIKEIPKEKYENIFKDQKIMYQKIKQEKLRSIINKFLYRMTYIKIGV